MATVGPSKLACNPNASTAILVSRGPLVSLPLLRIVAAVWVAVPFVGGEVGRVALRVSAAGASAEASGRSSRSTVDQLAILLGLAVGLVPSVPVVALYLLLRRAILVDETPS